MSKSRRRDDALRYPVLRYSCDVISGQPGAFSSALEETLSAVIERQQTA